MKLTAVLCLLPTLLLSLPAAASEQAAEPMLDLAPRLQAPGAVPAGAPGTTAPVARQQQDSQDKTWYGWQIVAVDAGLVLTAASLDSGELLIAWPLTGPAMHLLHGQPGRAAASLGVRVAVPLLAVHLATSDNDPSCSDIGCGLGEAMDVIAAAALGVLIAEGADSLLIAWKPTPVDEDVVYTRVVPVVAASDRSVVAGVGGFF